MSLLEVNKITPQSGTTLTLGDSGDTINFGSGVLPNFENLTVTGDLTVDTNSLKVDSANNRVGIGTASPTYSLQVDHQGSENVTIVAKGLAPGFGLYDTTASAYNWALYNSNGDFTFYNTLNTNGFNSLSEKMRITSGGNVGIGTTSPSSKLDVNGTVTATAFSGDGSALTGVGTTWESKSANFFGAAGTAYFVDTSSSAITATLPASPSTGDEIRFLDVAGTFDTNNLTVARNGNPIQGDASDLTVSTERAGFALVYYNGTQGWLLKDV